METNGETGLISQEKNPFQTAQYAKMSSAPAIGEPPCRQLKFSKIAFWAVELAACVLHRCAAWRCYCYCLGEFDFSWVA